MIVTYLRKKSHKLSFAKDHKRIFRPMIHRNEPGRTHARSLTSRFNLVTLAE